MMKEIFGNELEWLKGLTLMQQLIVFYFFVSLLPVCGLSADTPLWAGLTVLANFANSVRLLQRVPMGDEENL